ncbi:MAG TPA: TOBE domain-containing protein [Acidimicrobiales bacterium]|nr:TOBE domain-containing protein [Acidimicrobiales bacterium]
MSIATVPATVVRLVRPGSRLCVDLPAGGEQLWVQLTRGEADRLALAPGAEVHTRAMDTGLSVAPPPAGQAERMPRRR